MWGVDSRSGDFCGDPIRISATDNASESAIMNQTGHRSAAMVRRYIRDGSLFRDNASARVGL